jgi:hypothetical protein
VKPDIFANGGDRKGVTSKQAEMEDEVCRDIKCKTVFNIGDKIQSSSWLLKDFLDKHK